MVSDLQRSIDFYQELFGLPVESRQGSVTVALQVGRGPQHLGLTTNPASGDRTPRIDHLCLGLDGLTSTRFCEQLAKTASRRVSSAAPCGVQSSHARSGPWAAARRAHPRCMLGDPLHLTRADSRTRRLWRKRTAWNVCPAPSRRRREAAGSEGLQSLHAVRHRRAAIEPVLPGFCFDWERGSYQGPGCLTLAVGPLSSAWSRRRDQRGAVAVWQHQSFQPDRRLLRHRLHPEGAGKPRHQAARRAPSAPAAPTRHYVTMRMPD